MGHGAWGMGTYGSRCDPLPAWEPSGSRCDPLPFIIWGDCVPHPLKGAPPARDTSP